MTRAFDLKQLIAEEASGPAERRAMEEMASRLEEALHEDVPYRPAFKAQLRQRLVAEARRHVVPWYRRTSVIGSGVAVAAAAFVLVFGMNMWQQQGTTEQPPDATQPPAVTPQVAKDPTPVEQPGRISLVSDIKDAQPVYVPDTPLASVSRAPSPVKVDPSKGLELQYLTGRPDEAQFRTMAQGLAFRGESRRSSEGYVVEEGTRKLILTDDGKVNYTDSDPEIPLGSALIDAEGAKAVAYRFLDRAWLPIPGQAEVKAETGGFTVVYTEYLAERPVINAQTLVLVTDRGGVLKAEAYVSSGIKLKGSFRALTEAEALEEAKARGGSFDRADLVWVRTKGEETVYLQPYWRAYGTDSSGRAVARYVPALKR